jgi:hypothetical protein
VDGGHQQVAVGLQRHVQLGQAAEYRTIGAGEAAWRRDQVHVLRSGRHDLSGEAAEPVAVIDHDEPARLVQ